MYCVPEATLSSLCHVNQYVLLLLVVVVVLIQSYDIQPSLYADDMRTCPLNCHWLLRCSLWRQKYPMVQSATATIARGSSTAVTSWLRQHCAFCFATTAGRPHQPIAAGSSLVADCWSYYISIGGFTYRRLHNSAPEYLTRQLQRVSDVDICQRLRSSSSTDLVTWQTCRAINCW